jgi:hypothetical protein
MIPFMPSTGSMHNPSRATRPVSFGAQDRASPNFMGLTSLGLARHRYFLWFTVYVAFSY